ncbi:helix-turn-helix transcriptional regulator [Zavarzinia compransoris]|uniref:AraC family transcriptional regulator n=1 Tax=Zavarzinia marina TaxID=2911065 RepID=UPI001F3601C0|nr:helix-turn-helix transcriptional regulator [Zavarzinia marina]MCF4167345.1 helix-turn-helix transcriptional regulator [Zavarzinia marina]
MTAGAGDFDIRTLATTYGAGTVLAPHRHRSGQLVFAASGVMRVMTDGAVWLIPPTRAIWLPAGTRHAVAMQGDVAMRTLYIAAPRSAPLPEIPHVLEVAPLLRELILHVLGIGMLTPARPEHDRLAGLLIDLMLSARPEDLMLPLPRDARARRLAAHWQQEPGDRRDLAQLALEVGASLRTLQRLFSRETGLTLEAWRQKARLIHAVGRLVGGRSVTSVALDCGYESVAAFSAAFQRHFRTSPGRYRGGQRSS